MKTIKQEKPECDLKVCAECNQIRGYNQCKEDIVKLIDELKWLDEVNNYYKRILGEGDIAEKMFQFSKKIIKQKIEGGK